MSKLKIIDKKSIKSIKSELDLLSNLESPYIVNMHFAFQDRDNLYLVMDYLSGGDLRFHLSRHKKFSEEQTRFFICGLILSLEYIHSKNIIHRDIKPENLVLEENGYLRLTDFGIAKKKEINKNKRSIETSGTPGYMSPEVMKSLEHSFSADFFAVGVMGYEFMKGTRPYNGKNRKEIKEQILKIQAEIKPQDINENWSKESADFINKLLIREPEKRLGYKNIKELKEHPWLKYYPWSLIKDKKLPSPFIPENKDNFDKRYCEKAEKIGEETNNRYQEILEEEKIDNLFINFYFNENEDKRRIKRNKIEAYNTNINNIKSNNNKSLIIKENEHKLNISKLLRKKIDMFKQKIHKSEKEKDSVGEININKKIKKENDNKQKIKKAKHFKSGSITENKTGNMIYINFNINNNTNNNIIGDGNNINNFYISDKNQYLNDNIYNNNPHTERIKYILQNKLYNNYQNYNETFNNNINTYNNSNNNNSLFLGLTGITLNNVNSQYDTSLKKIIQKKQKHNMYKNNSVLFNNLSKQNLLIPLNTHKNTHKNLDISYKNKKNLSLNKSRHTFSRSFGHKDFEQIIIKKIKEPNNNTISINKENSFKNNFKKINKIPIGRMTQRISKNEYNINCVINNEYSIFNSKRRKSKGRMKSEEKYNSIKNIDKNNIEIKYSIQEIFNNDKTERNNSNLGKVNYIYSKKSLLERKNNQFNSPILKSNSYLKTDRSIPKIKKDNIIKLKEKGSQLNINTQTNKLTKIFKLNEEENNKNDSSRISINKMLSNRNFEKIKVNKMFK